MQEASNKRAPRGFLEQRNELGPKLVLVLCGLPARGKSYIGKKLCRYISWLGMNCKLFNVGNRRRTHASSSYSPEFNAFVTDSSQRNFHDAQFFDGTNEAARKLRDQLALETLEELIEWLQCGVGKVAIHDATNSTVQRRMMIYNRCAKEENLHVIFIESICTDPAVIEANIQMKLQGPDYAGMDSKLARNDFLKRMELYERAYEPIGAEEEKFNISYIKIVNVGIKVIAFNIKGYLGSQCVFYLMNIHIKNRLIWLTRHGESEFNVQGRIGGDSALTERGRKYSRALTRLLQKWYPADPDFKNVANFSLSPVSSVENIHDPRFYDPNASTPDTYSAEPPVLQMSPLLINPFDLSSASETCNSDKRSDAASVKSLHQAPSASTSSKAPKLSKSEHLIIYTSVLNRALQTAAGFQNTQYEVVHLRSLNELYAGVCEGLSLDEIKNQYPNEVAARAADKLNYRYPGPSGESYLDVIERLRPTIVEIERLQSPCLVVTHQVVLRTLLAYFCGLPLTQMTHLKVPLHSLYQLRPRPFGTVVCIFHYNEEKDDFDQIPFVPQILEDEQ